MPMTQRVHVAIEYIYILCADRGSHITTLVPKHILSSYMDPWAMLSFYTCMPGRVVTQSMHPRFVKHLLWQRRLPNRCSSHIGSCLLQSRNTQSTPQRNQAFMVACTLFSGRATTRPAFRSLRCAQSSPVGLSILTRRQHYVLKRGDATKRVIPLSPKRTAPPPSCASTSIAKRKPIWLASILRLSLRCSTSVFRARG